MGGDDRDVGSWIVGMICMMWSYYFVSPTCILYLDGLVVSLPRQENLGKSPNFVWLQSQNISI